MGRVGHWGVQGPWGSFLGTPALRAPVPSIPMVPHGIAFPGPAAWPRVPHTGPGTHLSLSRGTQTHTFVYPKMKSTPRSLPHFRSAPCAQVASCPDSSSGTLKAAQMPLMHTGLGVVGMSVGELGAGEEPSQAGKGFWRSLKRRTLQKIQGRSAWEESDPPATSSVDRPPPSP